MKKNFKQLLSVLFLSNVFISSSVYAQSVLNRTALEDRTKWEEVARDDFSGSTLNSTLWNKNIANDPNAGWGSEIYDDPSLCYLDGSSQGILHLKATPWRDASGQIPASSGFPTVPTGGNMRKIMYHSGMISANNQACPAATFHQESFGVYEARIKLPTHVWAWPAFWLWSSICEIDIVDGVNYDPAATDAGLLSCVFDGRRDPDRSNNPPQPLPWASSYATQHQGAKFSCPHRAKVWAEPGQQYPATANNFLTSGFNIFTMVWTPEKVSFFVNGRETHTVSRNAVATVPDFANLRISMNTADWADPRTNSADFEMQVDYVRILKPVPTNGPSSDCIFSSSSTANCASGQPLYRNFCAASNLYKYESTFMNHDVTTSANQLSNVSSAAGSIAIKSDDPTTVFYRGTDNNMYLAKNSTPNSSPTWSVVQLPRNTGEEVNGDLCYNANRNCVMYGGGSGATTIQAYALTSAGAWVHTQITNSSAISVFDASGSITSRTSDGRVVYIGTDRQIHYCDYNSITGTWQAVVNIPNTIGSAADAAGDVVLEQGTDNIFYKGSDERLQRYVTNGSAFPHSWIDNQWGPSDTFVSMKPKSMVMYQSTVYYIDKQDRIRQFAYDGATQTWGSSLLLGAGYVYAQTGYTDGDKAKGGIDYNGQANRVIYLGQDGRIQTIFPASSTTGSPWNHGWIDDYFNTGEFCSFNSSSPATNYSSIATTGNLTAFYCDRYNHLRYFNWESGENLSDSQCADGQNIMGSLHRGSNATGPGKGTAANTNQVGIADNGIDQITIAPNPTSSSVDIKLPASLRGMPCSYVIYSSIGAVVQRGVFSAGQGSLNLSSYKEGIYLLQVEAGNRTLHAKILKNQ